MDDFKWFLGVLLVIGVIWMSGKSMVAERSFSSATTTPKSRTVPASAPKTKAPANQAREGTGRLAPTTVISKPASQETVLNPDVSPLRGKLSIISVRQNASAPSEYVTVQASAKNKEDVVLTGLTLRSRVSLTRHKIPWAWNLPFPTNEGAGKETVQLRPGQRAYIISGLSPNGQSFQLNTCTGYFEQGMNFTPSLPLRCPAPASEPLPLPPNALSDACYDYLRTIQRCTVPPSTVPTALRSDGTCQAHLFSKINYTQCVADHKNDPDFFQGDWHHYLGRSKSSAVWRPKHDTVELLDADGRLIDARSY